MAWQPTWQPTLYSWTVALHAAGLGKGEVEDGAIKGGFDVEDGAIKGGVGMPQADTVPPVDGRPTWNRRTCRIQWLSPDSSGSLLMPAAWPDPSTEDSREAHLSHAP